MALDAFSKNLIALRKKHNLTTEQAAVIAGIERGSYEKMELGFEAVSYEVIEKLAKFYNVDVTYFATENEVEIAPEQKQVTPKTAKTKAVTSVNPKAGKATNIMTLISSILVFICFAIVPVITINGYTAFTWDLFGATDGLTTITFVLMFIYALWALSNSIIHLSSKNINHGIYGFVSKIINVAFGGLILVLEIVFFARSSAYFTIFLIHIAVALIDLIFNICKLVSHIKNNKKA